MGLNAATYTQIDREEQLEGKELTFETLSCKVGTFRYDCVGRDRLGYKQYKYRNGVETELGRAKISVDRLHLCQQEGFLSVMPSGYNAFGEEFERMLPASSVANLFPFSLPELAGSSSEREEQRLLENRMIYGLYPEVVTEPGDAKRTLMTLTNNYLYKDLYTYKGIKKPELIQKLVRALALQLGSEVSYNELSNLLGVDKSTVENYINLLEKCFVVFRLDSFSRNLRNEIKKGKKVYFYDNGVRNAVLSNFAPLELRNDVGALWENLMVSERVKRNAYHQHFAQLFFWRTHEQQEIDLVEEQDGRLHAFEFKWNGKAKSNPPKAFAASYPDSVYEVVTPENYGQFVR